MRIWMMALAVLYCTATFAQTDFEWERDIKNEKGKVTVLANGETWVIVPADNPNGRYISQQLPDEFKKDGLPVVYSGWVGKIPPNVRMLGTPLKLKSIKVAAADKKKFKLSKRCYKFS